MPWMAACAAMTIWAVPPQHNFGDNRIAATIAEIHFKSGVQGRVPGRGV